MRGLAILIALPLLCTLAAGQDTGSVSIDYTQGGSATGSIDAQLTVHQMYYRSAPSSPLLISGETVRIMQTVTTVNWTDGPGASILPNVVDAPQQNVSWLDLGPGEIEARWPIAGSDSVLLVAGPEYYAGGSTPFSIEVTATDATWKSPRPVAEGPTYWSDWGLGIGITQGGIGAWHRPTEFEDAAPSKVVGDFLLHARQAEIRMDGTVVLGARPYATSETIVETPAAVRRRDTYTDTFVYVTNGVASLPLAGAELAVSGATWHVSGDALFHSASGTYALGSHSGNFSHQSVGLSGMMYLHESLDPTGHGRLAGARAVHLEASGAFAVVAADFIVQASGPVGISVLEQALWITLVAGSAALLVWLLQHAGLFLYTRVREDAVLDHPRRAEIMQFIVENPGCHVGRLVDQLGLARGVARHHLLILEKASRIQRAHDRGLTLLIPHGQARAEALRARGLDEPQVRAVLALVEGSVARRAELVAQLRARHGIADTTARRWIQRAVRLGLVDEAGRGHAVTYQAAS